MKSSRRYNNLINLLLALVVLLSCVLIANSTSSRDNCPEGQYHNGHECQKCSVGGALSVQAASKCSPQYKLRQGVLTARPPQIMLKSTNKPLIGNPNDNANDTPAVEEFLRESFVLETVSAHASFVSGGFVSSAIVSDAPISVGKVSAVSTVSAVSAVSHYSVSYYPVSTLISASPTPLPTVLPTSWTPSCRPTTDPSISPSTKPTMKPTTLPSGQPTGQPSTRPSGQPTASPVKGGVVKTARPTPRPTAVPSCTPTTVPSASPTLSLTAQWRNKLSSVSAVLVPLQKDTFSNNFVLNYVDALVFGVDISSSEGISGCTRWRQFISQIAIRQIGHFVSSISVGFYSTLDAPMGGTFNISSSSTEVSEVASYVGTILQASNASTASPLTRSCISSVSGNKVNALSTNWTVGQYGGVPFLGISYNNYSFASITSDYLRFSSCSSCCNRAYSLSSVGMVRSVSVTFEPLYPAPAITDVLVTTYRDKISLAVSLEYDGVVYCAAFLSDNYVSPTSLAGLLSLSSPVASAGNSSTVNITSLIPSTEYIVLCAAASLEGTLTGLSDVLANNITTVTQCCRHIAINLMTKFVLVGNGISRNALTVSLEAASAGDMIIYLSLTLRNETFLYLTPSVVKVSAGAALQSQISLLNIPSVGEYTINATITSSRASDYQFFYGRGNIITVLPRNATPPAPTVLTARFSSDGAFLAVNFDSATDRSGLGLGIFNCSYLFAFSRSNEASCQWNDASTSISVSLSSDSILTVGDTIHLLQHRVRPYCSASFNCSAWLYSPLQNIIIEAPSSVTLPSVSVSSPSSIGSCDSLMADMSGSVGAGGRLWASTVFTVHGSAANVSLLTGYLDIVGNSDAFKKSMAVTIPSGFLVPSSQYSILITLCNFLSLCGSATISFTVAGFRTPIVSIVGPSTAVIKRSQALSLRATAFVSACSEASHQLTSSSLQYQWSLSVRQINNNSASSLSSLTSTTPVMFIPSYLLATYSTYDIAVTVLSTSLATASSSTMTVSVSPSVLVPVVSGSTFRSLRVGTAGSLDGSSSYDDDQSDFGKVGMTFQWQQWRLFPSYLSSCPVSLAGVNESVLTIFGSANATNSTCQFSLSVSLGRRTAVSTTTSIYFVGSCAPFEQITTSSAALAHIDAARQINIVGSVARGSSPLLCTWAISDPSVILSSVALSATVKTIPPLLDVSKNTSGFGAVNLILAPTSLAGGAAYTISLTCTFQSSSLSSVASVEVITNSAPVPGIFIVLPTFGMALTTSFVFSAASWRDDGDYPLYFEVGFMSPLDANAYLPVSSKLLVATTSAQLPAGLVSTSYYVTTKLKVYDSLGATASKCLKVQVNQSTANLTALSSLLSASLERAGLDTDAVKRAVVTTAVVLNTANCTNAPNCSALNRAPCSAVAATCGVCFSKFIGTAGDSNDPCVAASAVPTVAVVSLIVCHTDVDCGSLWYECDNSTHSCYSPSKLCKNNCGGASSGTCKFVSRSSGLAVSSCAANDLSCNPQCECEPDFYGQFCDLSAYDLYEQQEIRSKLLTAISNVIYIENAYDSSTVEGWSSSLTAVTANSYGLTSASIFAALTMIEYVIIANTGAGHSFQSVSSLLLATDNCVVSTGITDVFNDTVSSSAEVYLASAVDRPMYRRSLLSRDSLVSEVKVTIQSLADTSVLEMLPGQFPILYIQDNFRIYQVVQEGNVSVSSVLSATSAGSTLIVPSTANENVTGTVESMALAPASSEDMFISLISMKAAGLASYELATTTALLQQGQYLSNPVHLRFSSYLNSFDVSSPIVFTLANSVSVNASDVVLMPNISYTTTCLESVIDVIEYPCPYGNNITHVCNGLGPYSLTSTCSNREAVPVCGSTVNMNCSVTSFTDVSLECTCYLYNSSASTASGTSRSRRLHSIAQTYGAEIQSLTSYLAEDFTTTATSLASFNAHDVVRSVTVMTTFVTLWVVAFVLVLLSEYYNAGEQFGLKNKDKNSAKHSAQSTDGVVIRDYVFTFLPNIFTDVSAYSRLRYEIFTKHRYFSILLRDSGMNKVSGLFEILTILTAHMFLIAVLFDAQWPNDDGFCGQQVVESLCTAKKSFLNSRRSLCEWQTSKVMTSAGSVFTYQCSWQEPKFDVTTLIVITTIVIAFSGPINAFVSAVINRVIMSPSEDMASAKRSLLQHRAHVDSAVLNDTCLSRANSPRSHAILPSSLTDVLYTQEGHLLDKLTDVDDTLIHFCMDEQRLRKRFETLVPSGRSSTPEASRSDADVSAEQGPRVFDDVSNLISELQEKCCSLDDCEKTAVIAHWPQLFGATADAEYASIQLADEVYRVRREASEVTKELATMPQAIIGVKVLELLVLDLMGRDSRQAKIFINQRPAVTEKLITKAWLKVLAILFLLGLNICFVLLSMLYGSLKGRNWQFNWMVTCIVYICSDVFIRHFNNAYLIHYFIPEMISNHTLDMRQKLVRAVGAFVANAAKMSPMSPVSASSESSSLSGDTHFSVTEYLFVSTLVARAYPNLLESQIALSYRSLFVSEHQSQKFKRLFTDSRDVDKRQRWRLGTISSSLSMGFASVLLWLGTQHILVQRALVQAGNPLIMGFIAFIGSKILTSSLLGALVVVSVVVVAVVVALMFGSSASNKPIDEADLKGPTTEEYYDEASLSPYQRQMLFELKLLPADEDSSMDGIMMLDVRPDEEVTMSDVVVNEDCLNEQFVEWGGNCDYQRKCTSPGDCHNEKKEECENEFGIGSGSPADHGRFRNVIVIGEFKEPVYEGVCDSSDDENFGVVIEI
jgi:ribosomal protein L14